LSVFDFDSSVTAQTGQLKLSKTPLFYGFACLDNRWLAE
jgi:hypothetical protein